LLGYCFGLNLIARSHGISDFAGPTFVAFEIETEGDEDRLVQLDAMRLQARTWNCVTVLAVISSTDLVGIKVLGVRVAGNVLFSRPWILVATDASDTIPYVRPVDGETQEGGFPRGLMVDFVDDYELVRVVGESENLGELSPLRRSAVTDRAGRIEAAHLSTGRAPLWCAQPHRFLSGYLPTA